MMHDDINGTNDLELEVGRQLRHMVIFCTKLFLPYATHSMYIFEKLLVQGCQKLCSELQMYIPPTCAQRAPTHPPTVSPVSRHFLFLLF